MTETLPTMTGSLCPPTQPRTLRDLRKAAGLTQAELAELMGVQQVTVSQWERIAWPTLDKLPGLALALGITLDELVAVLISMREGRSA